jgi:PAS domain S-box-containing protein
MSDEFKSKEELLKELIELRKTHEDCLQRKSIDEEHNRNIIERKHIEEELRKSEEKFRTIADFTYDWEYWVGPNKEILYCSPSCTRISGYSPEEFIKNPDLLRSIIHPGNIQSYCNHLDTIYNSHDDVPEIEFRIITKSGEERWIGHACKAVFNEEGKYLGRRISSRDITDRKRKEKEIEESRHQINTLNNNILKMLRIMSHDIRSPLIATSATLKLLLRGTYGKLDASVFQTVKDLSTRIEQILGLAEDCLAKAQVVDSELQIEKNEIDLRREVIEIVLAELAMQIDEKNIFVYNRLGALPTGTIAVSASKMWLKVVYRNLFSNAIKYGGYGCTIAFGFEDRGSYYRFNVYNTGIPIPEDKRSILFTKFGRVIREEDTVQDGIGMGLFMTKEIINQHGGDIWYEARHGGNDFIFTLPK